MLMDQQLAPTRNHLGFDQIPAQSI